MWHTGMTDPLGKLITDMLNRFVPLLKRRSQGRSQKRSDATGAG